MYSVPPMLVAVLEYLHLANTPDSTAYIKIDRDIDIHRQPSQFHLALLYEIGILSLLVLVCP